MASTTRTNLLTSMGAAVLLSTGPMDLTEAFAQQPPGPPGGSMIGESGEGGEFGVDPEAALNNPVPYLTALEVIRAHYLAGAAAYTAGAAPEAAEMFAHPIAEVYVDLEPVFEALGVSPFQELMITATNVALEEGNDDAVTAAVEAVLAAVDAAEARAPETDQAPAAVEGRVLSDGIERTVLQYQLAHQGGVPSAYLDGFGYFKAVQSRAVRTLPIIADADPETAATIERTLALIAPAFASVEQPETLTIEPGVLLGASSAVAFSVVAL